MPKLSAQKPPLSSPPPHVHSQSSEYGVAALIGLGVASFFGLYMYYRTGGFNMPTFNRALGDTSIALLGFILLIGTGSRLFSFPDKMIPYRKEIGITAFLFALAHFIVSLFFIPDRYSYKTLLQPTNQSMMFGLAALIILVLLFLSSRQKIMAILGTKLWWKFQYWGLRSTFVLVGLHILIMKWERWVSWYQEGSTQKLAIPAWPSIDLLVGWFMLFVILIRLSELGGPKFAKTIWYLSFVALPLIYAGTFWWGTYLLTN